MTQEDKELLLKDICVRLPYGIIINVHDTFPYSTLPYFNMCLNSFVSTLSFIEPIFKTKDKLIKMILKEHTEYLEFKPYLRPMSSMTNDERKYIEDKCAFTTIGPIGGKFCLAMPVVATEWLTDFYNSHYLDWRGLIQMGLAIEASKGMYNIKEEK